MNESTARCAVLIEGDLKADFGYVRSAIGTGFIGSMASESVRGLYHNYIITCAHVIRPQIDRGAPIDVRVRSVDRRLMSIRVNDWFFPENAGIDLAVAEFQAGIDPHGPDGTFIFNINGVVIDDSDHAITDENAGELQLGAPVVYAGLLAPMQQMALVGEPMVRSGSIGALYVPNIAYETYDFTGHLIDCRSYGGFSGSPIFVNFQRMAQQREPDGRLTLLLLTEIRLFGMLTGHLTDHLPPSADDDGVHARFGIGSVLPIGTIRKFIMKRFEEDRARRNADWKNENS